ncbi:MAG TPA: homoserine dehydrogenase [Candidatus Eisenbacteria bacterium]|nr:homoserine dehydrogenase [Candidatus Eisenbacteria bacterium]
MNGARLRVGVLGAGNVGREVVRVLLDQPDSLRAVDGVSLELAGVAVRDVAAAEARGIPAALLTDAPAHLVAAPDVDVIVELMGGEQPAATLIAAALGAGRSVVTANKAVLAGHGAELEAAARRTGATLRFEAAVGGGTPILSVLASDLVANRIAAVRGIVNGTTNFILSEMAATGRTYEVVLAEAQAAGYAEADPAADVEGRDAINKLVILARLAFGTWLDPAGIGDRVNSGVGTGLPGVTGVTAEDIAGARRRGLVIRLLATAHRASDGASIEASVVPTAVSVESPFGRTIGVLNRIEVDAEPVGQLAFEGPGAGGSATASAVLADLIAIGRGLGSTWAGLPPAVRADDGPRAPTRRAASATADGLDAWFDGPSGARYPIVE